MDYCPWESLLPFFNHAPITINFYLIIIIAVRNSNAAGQKDRTSSRLILIQTLLCMVDLESCRTVSTMCDDITAYILNVTAPLPISLLSSLLVLQSTSSHHRREHFFLVLIVLTNRSLVELDDRRMHLHSNALVAHLPYPNHPQNQEDGHAEAGIKVVGVSRFVANYLYVILSNEIGDSRQQGGEDKDEVSEEGCM